MEGRPYCLWYKFWEDCFHPTVAYQKPMLLSTLPRTYIFIRLFVLFLIVGCSRPHMPTPPEVYQPPAPEKRLSRMGYAIQVGAFSQAGNAAKLASSLNKDSLDAYYFLYNQGLYKVRFGNFPTRELAAREAEMLKALSVIDNYYIVLPEEYAITGIPGAYDELDLRKNIVKTAESFMGVPYQWGGASAEKGFDCSGLAMAIYRLNGLTLPRTSVAQYNSGSAIQREQLSEGDLIFFDTSGEGGISHVGIYIGNGRFIHAPSTGKTVQTSFLSSPYYKECYIGARAYL